MRNSNAVLKNSNKKGKRGVEMRHLIKLIDWKSCCSVCPNLIGVTDMEGGPLDAATVCVANGTCYAFAKRKCETFAKMTAEYFKNINPMLLERAAQTGIQLPPGLLAA